MKKCPTCGQAVMTLADVPRAVLDGIVNQMVEDLKRQKKVPGRAAGGHARAERLTPERRREIAVKAAAARWTRRAAQ